MTLATATFQGHALSGRLDLRPRHRSSTRRFPPTLGHRIALPRLRRRPRADAHLCRQGHTARALRRGAGHEVVPARRARRVSRAVCWRPTPTRKATSGSAPCATRAWSIPRPSAVVARGKKLQVGNEVRRARRDASSRATSNANGDEHLAPHHVPLPRRRRAAHRRRRAQGANKIEPVLTYQMQGDTSRVGHDPQRRRHDEPAHQDLERLLAAPLSRVHHGDGVLLRRGAAPGLHGPLPRRREHRARAVLAAQPQQLRRADRRVAERRCAGRHLSPARRRGAAPARPGPAVRGLHFERVPAAKGHEQQPRGRRRVRGPHRAPRREGALLPRRPPARHRVRGRRHVPARRCRSIRCCRSRYASR